MNIYNCLKRCQSRYLIVNSLQHAARSTQQISYRGSAMVDVSLSDRVRLMRKQNIYSFYKLICELFLTKDCL